ncbi:MAG: ATP-dependent zinc metalloprotease FtsH [Proteobacteria bacterium]|jgi:cell division protease FtsH|nr:ATP-dependent zinc metalloprotease FtsH [Pseudomonadota bacterium]
MQRSFLFTAFGLLLLLGALVWLAQLTWSSRANDTSWTEFKALVESGDIEEVVIGGGIVRGKRRSSEGPLDGTVRVVYVPEDEGFIELLENNGVPYRGAASDGCVSVAPWILLLFLLFLFIFVAFARQADIGGRGAAAFGRSTATLAPEEGTGVNFNDVAGVEEAREELMEVVQFLDTPDRFTSLGGRPPKGVLLVGPPGTGKTLLARAVAGEAGVPFFSISGSAFVEMFVGVGAARVRDLFKQGLERAPCIIFVDELDAVGKARGVGPSGNEEREQTLNQLLVEMDGFDNRKGIIVMAATNRPEILDAALLRAGRFDRQILVDRPDLRGRTAILEVHARNLKLGEDVDLEHVARLTPGFAGADLSNTLNEAALLGARKNRDAICMDDITEAIERTIAGLEKKTRRMSDSEKKTVAYHECGHAICAAASPGADPVTKISIIPRGIAALGYTIQLPVEDRYLASKAELLNRVTILFGGRAAEELIFGDVTTGAQDDIRKATSLARRMVTEFGMSKQIGPVNYAETQPGTNLPSHMSTDTAEVIEREIRLILDRCRKRSLEILHTNRLLLEEMAIYLLNNEVLAGGEMNSFLARTELAESLEDRPTAEWQALVEQ